MSILAFSLVIRVFSIDQESRNGGIALHLGKLEYSIYDFQSTFADVFKINIISSPLSRGFKVGYD